MSNADEQYMAAMNEYAKENPEYKEIMQSRYNRTDEQEARRMEQVPEHMTAILEKALVNHGREIDSDCAARITDSFSQLVKTNGNEIAEREAEVSFDTDIHSEECNLGDLGTQLNQAAEEKDDQVLSIR